MQDTDLSLILSFLFPITLHSATLCCKQWNRLCSPLLQCRRKWGEWAIGSTYNFDYNKMLEDNNQKNCIKQVLTIPESLQILWAPSDNLEDLPSTTTDSAMQKLFLHHTSNPPSNVVSGVSLFTLPHSKLYMQRKTALLHQIQHIIAPSVFENKRYMENNELGYSISTGEFYRQSIRKEKITSTSTTSTTSSRRRRKNQTEQPPEPWKDMSLYDVTQAVVGQWTSTVFFPTELTREDTEDGVTALVQWVCNAPKQEVELGSETQLGQVENLHKIHCCTSHEPFIEPAMDWGSFSVYFILFCELTKRLAIAWYVCES